MDKFDEQKRFYISGDSDCDDDTYSNVYCIGNDVYQDYYDFSCLIGSCYADITSYFVDHCEYGCDDGTCNPEPPTCTQDSDCGSSPTEELICVGDYVKNKITTPTCVSGSCQSIITYENVEYCEFGCSNGECEEESRRDENESPRPKGRGITK